MGLVDKMKQAFKKAVRSHNGRLVRLQEHTGVDYSTINNLNSGKRQFENITVQTFEKLFPEMEVSFFRDERIASETTDPLLREILTNWDDLTRSQKHKMLGQLYEQLESNPPEEVPAPKHRKAG